MVAFELFAIAWVRKRFLEVSMRSSLLVVTVGGVIVSCIGIGDRRRGTAAASVRVARCKTRWYTGVFP